MSEDGQNVTGRNVRGLGVFTRGAAVKLIQSAASDQDVRRMKVHALNHFSFLSFFEEPEEKASKISCQPRWTRTCRVTRHKLMKTSLFL